MILLEWQRRRGNDQEEKGERSGGFDANKVGLFKGRA